MANGPFSRSKDTYLAAKYRRIATRRGPIKAVVAVEHAMLIATWHMITNGDFYTRRDPDSSKKRALDQLRKLGYAVTLDPLQAAG